MQESFPASNLRWRFGPSISSLPFQISEGRGPHRSRLCASCAPQSTLASDRALRNVLPRMQSIRIPGDGRCLFRAVAHGACLRAGKPSPSESLQKELADELRSNVADEFIRRRADSEWFLEGDFDTYIKQIRKPHIWGGEPELLMCSHVLRMPITVYMCNNGSDSLKVIAEYGQEYGKEDPIRVLYHGYGHYDAVQVPLRTREIKIVYK